MLSGLQLLPRLTEISWQPLRQEGEVTGFSGDSRSEALGGHFVRWVQERKSASLGGT